VPRLYLRWPDRLWKRLEVYGVIRTDPPSEWPKEPCWLWIGGKNGHRRKHRKIIRNGGYGYVRGPDGKMTRVHLLTFRELRGVMPSGYISRHTCIGPHHCGNPWHVEPGTISENNTDTYAQGHR